MNVLLLVGFLLFVGACCGWMAASKGRNVVVWAVLGATLPLLAWPTLLALKDKKSTAF